MNSTTRSAHRRVGAVAIAVFLALLLLGLNRGPASANPAAPAATPTTEPSQPVPDFDHDGHRPRGGFRGGGGGPGFGGGEPAPSTPSAPSTGTTTT